MHLTLAVHGHGGVLQVLSPIPCPQGRLCGDREWEVKEFSAPESSGQVKYLMGTGTSQEGILPPGATGEGR